MSEAESKAEVFAVAEMGQQVDDRHAARLFFERRESIRESNQKRTKSKISNVIANFQWKTGRLGEESKEST